MKCSKCDGKKRLLVMIQPNVYIEITCEYCKGTGKVNIPNVCQRCNGSKKVILLAKNSPLNINTEIDCPDCSSLQIIK